MTIRMTLLLGSVAVAAAIATFQVKYTVVSAERDLLKTLRQIEDEKWRIRSLRADLANLALPTRMALQARQLGMEEMTVSRVIDIGQLGMADHLRLSGKTTRVELEPGTEPFSLQFRPVIQPNLLSKGTQPKDRP